MYVVKLRYKDSKEICYSNESTIHSVAEIRKEDTSIKLDWYTMPIEKARKLFIELISRNNESNKDYGYFGWGGDSKKLDFISIVELSNYDSKREYQVIDYKEFS